MKSGGGVGGLNMGSRLFEGNGGLGYEVWVRQSSTAWHVFNDLGSMSVFSIFSIVSVS